MMKIRDLAHLQELADNGQDGELPPLSIELKLFGSVAKSTKYIQYSPARNGRHWWLEEYEEGHYYTAKQLLALTNLGEGLSKGALYAEVQEEGGAL